MAIFDQKLINGLVMVVILDLEQESKDNGHSSNNKGIGKETHIQERIWKRSKIRGLQVLQKGGSDQMQEEQQQQHVRHTLVSTNFDMQSCSTCDHNLLHRGCARCRNSFLDLWSKDSIESTYYHALRDRTMIEKTRPCWTGGSMLRRSSHLDEAECGSGPFARLLWLWLVRTGRSFWHPSPPLITLAFFSVDLWWTCWYAVGKYDGDSQAEHLSTGSIVAASPSCRSVSGKDIYLWLLCYGWMVDCWLTKVSFCQESTFRNSEESKNDLSNRIHYIGWTEGNLERLDSCYHRSSWVGRGLLEDNHLSAIESYVQTKENISSRELRAITDARLICCPPIHLLRCVIGSSGLFSQLEDVKQRLETKSTYIPISSGRIRFLLRIRDSPPNWYAISKKRKEYPRS